MKIILKLFICLLAILKLVKFIIIDEYQPLDTQEEVNLVSTNWN